MSAWWRISRPRLARPARLSASNGADDLIDFAERARRGGVASASAAQIARGLYTNGAGQWRRYRAQLEPVLPTLAPWVTRYGYPAD